MRAHTCVAKHFTSWLGLAPSNKVSGGKMLILDDLGSDTKLFCPPETASTLERVRVIVTYIEGVPKRMTDGFGLLANEAMAKA